jgi:hypothetical protein
MDCIILSISFMFQRIVVGKKTGIFSMLLLAATVSFADMPKSGVIKWHTGWQFSVPNSLSISEGHMMAIGMAKGYGFGDSNPQDKGSANCFGAFEIVGGEGSFIGFCSFELGEKDKDLIFSQFTGSPIKNEGTNVITGGTGKYKGITGQGTWKCEGGKNSESACQQTLNYKLP